MKEINLGRILVENRHKRGITQDELAAYMGVSKAAVSKWETGMTYPDITLLPQLATYFNISIDELIGYEPQMTKEQIRVLCRKLATDFSTLPIEKVREQCQEITKKYFSCFPLLYQIGSLYVNYSPLVENKATAKEMLEDASRLFERVKSETDNVDLAKQALNMEALCQLTLGNPSEVLNLLGEPDFSMTSTEPLLASAYHFLGNKKVSVKAKGALERLSTAFKLERSLNEYIANYSLGMKQKVYLIAAFLSGAGNLILDEPFNGLDPESVAALKKLLLEHRDAGNLVLFSAHNLDLVANFCDDVVFIDKQRKIFQLENPRDFAQLESSFFQKCV